MKIKVNDISREMDIGSFSTLKDVIEGIMLAEVAEGCILRKVLLNGVELTEDQDSHLDEIPVSDVWDLAVFTATPWELIRITAGQLAEVEGEINKIADCFRYEDTSEANRRLTILVEIFQKFVGLLGAVKGILKLDFSTITIDGQTLEGLQLLMLETLGRLLASQKDKDWVGLADILQFELAPLLNTWLRIIPILACPSDGKPN